MGFKCAIKMFVACSCGRLQDPLGMYVCFENCNNGLIYIPDDPYVPEKNMENERPICKYGESD